MARKKRKNVDYFPHLAHHKKPLRIINKKYGNDGYAFYFKLRELLAKTDYHNYDLSNDIDWQDFVSEMDIDEKKAVELIEFMVRLEELDEDMWKNEKRLWSENLKDDLLPVYNKRKSRPHKYSYRDGYDDLSADINVLEEGGTQRKGKKSKEKKRKVEDDSSIFNLDYFIAAYPQVDVHKSYKKFQLDQQIKGYERNNEKAEFEKWVLRDIDNEWNLRPQKIKKQKIITRWCTDCNRSFKLTNNGTENHFCEDCEIPLWPKREYESIKSKELPF